MMELNQKVICSNEIEKACNSLSFFSELQTKGKLTDETTQTTFSINRYAISRIASLLGVESSIKDSIEEKAKKNRRRRERISYLEKQITEQFDPETYDNTVKNAFFAIGKRWRQEGFISTGKPKGRITSFGKVEVTLELLPIEKTYQLFDEREQKELLPLYQAAFQNHEFVIDPSSPSRVRLLDTDINKRKIETIINRLFPGSQVIEWKCEKHTLELRSLSIQLANSAFSEVLT